MNRKLYIFALLCLITIVGFGQQVEFKTQLSKESIGMNERLKVEFTMNHNGDNFIPPDFKDFRIFSGPVQNVQKRWVNGKSEFSKSYIFYLVPQKRGTLSIGQAEVRIDGNLYKTSPVTVEVTAAVDDPKDGDGEKIIDVSSDIHVVVEISNAEPYLNEAVVLTYKFYVSPRQSVSNIRNIDDPKFPNFWSHNINTPFKVNYGSFRGEQNYKYVVLKKVVLYPQKTGELKIEPLTVDFTVDVPTDRRDYFGGILYKSVPKTLSSKGRIINVKSLPEQGKPESFTGAVGSFKFETKATKNELEADESLDIKMEVNGRGNLKLFQLPELKTPNAFELYEPEHVDNSRTDNAGMYGSVYDTYTLVPKQGGSYTINPVEFSYFDPKTGKYVTLTSDEIKINVKGSPLAAPTSSAGDDLGLAHKQQVTASGKQFQYIHLNTRLKDLNPKHFFKSTTFWAMLISPFLLLPFLIFAGRKRMAVAGDKEGRKAKEASQLTRKYLSEAKKTMGSQMAYYEALERALYNYLKAKFNIPMASMSKDNIYDLLIEKEVSEETGKDFINLLESCEFARFTPASDLGMKQDYDKAVKIISEVDKQLKA